MSYNLGHHPGAVWRKTDLQIHTPRDPNWTGEAPVDDAGRKAWADAFVVECLKRGLGAIAITDHHDVVMASYVQDAINRSDQANGRLWLLPGMEVTCNDSVQCLVLFDQGTPTETVERLFGGHLLKAKKGDPAQPHAPQANICGKDIDEFLGSVHEDSEFAGIVIVLPHASKGGHKDTVTGLQTKIKHKILILNNLTPI